MTQQPPLPPGPPPWQQPPPAQHAQPTKAGIRSRWWFIPAIALAALIVGLAIGGSSGSSSSAKSGPAATVTAAGPTSTATVQVTTTPTKVVATRTMQVRVTYTPPPVNEFSDGTFRVGPDIPAGVYKTAGGSQCYYAVLNSLDTNDIASNDNFTGPTVVQLRSGKAFQTSGGCDWSRVG